MTDAQASTSLAQHVRPLEAGAQVVGAAFVGGSPALVLGEGAVLIGEPDAQTRVVPHPDAAILSVVSDGKTLLTGGDDGRVAAIGGDALIREIADEKGRWIDALALRGGSCAWSAGKQVSARDETGATRTWTRADDRARPRLSAEGLPSRGHALQRRVALVSEGRRSGPDARMERRASRRDLLARRAFPCELHAGERAARLAARGFAQHAHDRLSRKDPLRVLVA